MAGIDDIVQRVVLTGNDDVAEAFDKMREAGVRAFDGIERAAEHSVFSVTGVVTAVAGIAAAVAAVSVGVFAFVRSTSETVHGMEELSKQTGTTIEDIAGLKAAFANGGVGAGQLEQSFRRLSIIIQQSWTQIRKESAESADKLKGDSLAVSNALLGLEQAQRNSANFAVQQANLEKQNAFSVREARLRLRELDGEDVGTERERLTRLRARQSLQQAVQKQEEDAAKAASEAQRVANAEEQAQLTLNQARRKAREDELNDINRVTEAVRKVGAADTPQAGTEILKGINASAENIAQGIINSTKGADESLVKLRGDITDLAEPAPGVMDVFEHLGEVLRNIEDPTLKTAIASRLLGRTIRQELISVIADPAKLDAFRQHVKGLGIDFEDANHVSEKFRSAMFSLQSDIELIGIKIGAAFGPGATQVLQSLDAALLRNRDSITKLAERISSAAVPVIESLIRVLEGAPRAADDQWLVDYKDSLVSFGEAVAQVVSVIKSIIVAIVSVAGTIGETLNTVIGTNLNAIDVLIGLFLAKVALSITAAAVAIGKAVVAVVVAQRAISAALIAGQTAAEAAAAGTAAAAGVMGASMVPIIATMAAVGLAIFTALEVWKAWKKAVGDEEHAPKFDIMDKGATDRLKAIRDFLVRPPSIESLKQVRDEIKKIDDEQRAAEKKRDEEDLERKKKNAVETKSIHEEAVGDMRQAQESLAESTEKATSARTSSEKRVAEQIRQTASETEKLFQEQKKSTTAAGARNKKNADGSITDENGIKVFPGPDVEGSGVAESLAFAAAKAVASKLGGRPEDVDFGGFAFGRAAPIGNGEGGQVVKPPPILPNRKGVLDERTRDELNAPNVPSQRGVLAERAPEELSTAATELKTAAADLKEAAAELRQPETQQTDNNDNGNALSNFLNSVESALGNLISTITDYIMGAKDVPNNISESLSDASSSAESLSSALQDLVSSAQSAAAALANLSDSGTVEAASGGHIRGPGSETSDSILARLSDNEYVQPARATRHYGVEFMHAVRSLSFPRFAAGGLMSFSLPRFRDGGAVMFGGAAAGMPHLGTVDLTTNHGVVRVGVDRDSLSQLRRAAVNRNLGAERKPSWVK